MRRPALEHPCRIIAPSEHAIQTPSRRESSRELAGGLGGPVIVLGISTSTERGSVALVSASGVLAEDSWLHLEGHAERLFAALDGLLARAGLDRRAISLVACDVGPGSFTGVRVGVASAQGVALALGVPTRGVSSLEVMAREARRVTGHVGDVVAVLDAKKDEAFLATFGAGAVEPAHVPRDAARAALGEARARGAMVVGSFAAGLIGEAVTRGGTFDLPDAGALGRAAIALGADEGPLEPLYVRAPDAKPMV